MKNLFLIIFFSCVLAQLIIIPFYINFLLTGKPYKLKKIICSTLFIVEAFCAVSYNGSFSVFSVLMLVALVLSWLGDLFLAVSLESIPFVLGLGSFLLGHITYVAAYSKAVSNILSKGFSVEAYEIIIILLMLTLCLIVKKKAKIKLSEMSIPVLVYALAISFMLARAVRLGVACIQSGMSIVSVIMICAAVLFVISDAVLVFIIFKKINNAKTQTPNIAAYYAAQVLLASSIFFLG